MSKLTNLFVAHNLIDAFDYEKLVDWAIELLEEDVNSESVKIAAGLIKPINYFEGKRIAENILDDLGINDISILEKKKSYCEYYIEKIANGEDVRKNLTEVYKYCQNNNIDKLVYDFFLLYWAWDDLDYADVNYYWEEAKRDNINDIVIEKAKEWLINSEGKES